MSKKAIRKKQQESENEALTRWFVPQFGKKLRQYIELYDSRADVQEEYPNFKDFMQGIADICLDGK